MDSYSMMITSKYFRSRNDYINMICVNSKYKKILKQFRYNPIPIRTIKLFPKIQTQHIYTIYDVILDDVNRYVIWYPVQSYNDVIEEQNGKIKILKNISCVVGTNNYHLRTIPSCCTVLNRYLCDTLKTESLVLPTSITSLGSFFHEKTSHIQHKIPYFLSMMLSQQNIECLRIQYTNSDVRRYGNNIPSICEEIGGKCFTNSHIQTINIPSTITSLQKKSFFMCLLSTVILPSTIKSIPNKCFQFCYGLKNIDCSHVTHLGDFCFYLCQNLTSLTLSSKLLTTGRACLDFCHTSLSILKGINTYPSTLFFNCYSTSLSIPSTISSIKSNSFS
ncbi:Leucine rich repeat containing protein BspA family protein [Entamoeba marina]